MKLTITFLLLTFCFTVDSYAQWNWFRADRIIEIEDTTDIYLTIEENFGKQKRFNVSAFTNKLISYDSQYFQEYFKYKSADQLVELYNKTLSEIQILKKYLGAYKFEFEKSDNSINNSDRLLRVFNNYQSYNLSLTPNFGKTIIDFSAYITFKDVYDNHLGTLDFGEKNLSLKNRETFVINIHEDKVLKVTKGSKNFKYNVGLRKVAFSDFSTFDFFFYLWKI